jgi:hypothetical protein
MVAQVMAEADRENLFNKEYLFDNILIRFILTDGISFEFYFRFQKIGVLYVESVLRKQVSHGMIMDAFFSRLLKMTIST